MEVSLRFGRPASKEGARSMDRQVLVALAYAVAFAGFLVIPAAFRTQAPSPFPAGFYWQEVIDLFTPLVLIPLSWLLCGLDDGRTRRATQLLFLVLAAVWVEGQAMHLAANSIGRPWEHAASPSGALAGWYDETLSHYVWHAGIDAIFALAIIRSLNRRFEERTPLPVGRAALAAAILGFSWFMVVIESGTAPLDIPFMLLALGYAAVWGRRRVRLAPVALVLVAGFALTLVLVGGWAIAWHGLPQFTEVGWL